MRRLVIAGSLLLVLTGCAELLTDATDATSRPTTTTITSPTTTGTSPTTTGPSPTSSLAPVVDCPGIGEFEEGGGIADIDGSGSDSARLGRISWDDTNQCETFRFEFETSEGAPATAVPDVRVEHLDSFQVIRIQVGVDVSVIADQQVDTDLVDRLYVVRSLDGGLYVDLHLAAPVAARVTALDSPARLSIELRPGFVPFTGTSASTGDVVLVAPGDGSEVGTSIDLAGYTRSLEPDVLVVVTRAGTLVSETSTVAADASDVWGEFRTELTLPPGEVAVFVGETSTEDGSLQGLTIDVNVS